MVAHNFENDDFQTKFGIRDLFGPFRGREGVIKRLVLHTQSAFFQNRSGKLCTRGFAMFKM